MPPQDTLNEFIQSCGRKELSEHTLRAYSLDLRHFREFCDAHEINFSLVLPKHVVQWLDYLHISGLSPASRKRHLASLKVFYRWFEKEYDVSSPFAGLELPIKLPKLLPKNIQEGYLKRIFQHIDQIDEKHNLSDQTLKIALELLVSTGVRVSELCRITINDVDIDAGTIRIAGKGSRERTVFILEGRVKTILNGYISRWERYRDELKHLLLKGHGRALTPEYLRRSINAMTTRLGIPVKITPHMFRHSAATLLLESGVDIRFVQRLLGHASLSTTEIYTHVTENSLKQALMQGNVRARLI